MKKHCLIFPALVLLYSMHIAATNGGLLEIPEDSTARELRNSFHAKLDSALLYEQDSKYRASIKLYEDALEEIKQYNHYRREQMAVYLEDIYETEYIEKQISYLNETVELRKIQNLLLIILVLGIAGILVFLSIMLFYRLRSVLQRAGQEENRANISKLEKEKQELEIQLHSVEAEKTQKELLAESLLVDYKNRIIDDLSELLIRNPALNNYKKELETILKDEEPLSEQNMQPSDIKEIHPQFYTRLQEMANNKLTALDLEYCRMIFLNISSKEMADILEVDPGTIRMGKYRLKQKLGLTKDDDLNGVIGGWESHPKELCEK